MTRLIIKHILYGLVVGWALFVAWIIFLDVTGSDTRHDVFENFTVYALSWMVMSIGFCVSTVVYDIDRLALWLKIFINVTVGFGIFFFVWDYVGTIPFQSPLRIVSNVAIAVVIGVVVFFIDCLINKREADKINAKLREQEGEKPLS